MTAHNLLSLAFVALVPSVFATPAHPQITTHARLEVRATPTSPNLIGYVSALGTFSPRSCGKTATWSTVGSYGACCATQYNNCDFATACKSGTIAMYTDGPFPCTNTAAPACVVDYVVNDLFDQKTINWIGCDVSRAPSTYIRDPTGGSSTPSTTTPSSTSARTTSSTSTISSSAAASTTPAAPASVKKSNVGIIAGAAVGGLAILALLAGLLIWILLNKKNKTNKANAAAAGAVNPNNGQPPAQYPQQPMQQQYNAGYMSPEQQRASMFQPGSPPPVYPQEYKTPIVTSDAIGSNGGFGQQQYQPQGVSPITPGGGYQAPSPQMNREMSPPMNGAHEMPITKQ